MRTVIPKNAKLIPKEAECVFKGKIFDVYQWQQKMFDGSFDTFEMLKRPDTVQIIAIKDNKITLLEEEQPGYRPFMGLPTGRHDNGSETEIAAAKRELLEETGMTFQNWRLIWINQPHLKIDWFVYTFLATALENEVTPTTEPGEKIKLKKLSLAELKGLKDDPKFRWWPEQIISKVNTIQDLVEFPEYRDVKL